MGTNLKILCDVAFKVIIEKSDIPHIKWNDTNQSKLEIKDFRKLVERHWCNELSSLALKNLKEKQWKAPLVLPLTSDISLFQTYTNALADKAYNNLNSDKSNIRENYKILTECVLALTIMFNRKRVEDVQYLQLTTYNLPSTSKTNEEAFMQALPPLEKIL